MPAAAAFSAPSRARQRGMALYVILVVVMLSMLLALWSSRTALFNEIVVGNDADYQRAFEAAQAMIQDAELDIRRENPDGSPCAVAGACRAGANYHFPAEESDLGLLIDRLGAENAKCREGICQKRTGAQNFWSNPVALAAMTAPGVGARFGEYTGLTAGGADQSGATPILATTASNQGAWYWVEVMPYNRSSQYLGHVVIGGAGGQNMVPLHALPAVAYRITAIAQGIKPGSRVVLQQTYVRQKLKD
jgi:type IV pilus assembly protein PilX